MTKKRWIWVGILLIWLCGFAALWTCCWHTASAEVPIRNEVEEIVKTQGKDHQFIKGSLEIGGIPYLTVHSPEQFVAFLSPQEPIYVTLSKEDPIIGPSTIVRKVYKSITYHQNGEKILMKYAAPHNYIENDCIYKVESYDWDKASFSYSNSDDLWLPTFVIGMVGIPVLMWSGYFLLPKKRT